MKMKAFKNEEEYDMAVDMLEKIGDREDFETNTELQTQFETLSNLIERYENENANIEIGHPIEIIKLKMSYLGLKQKDLQPYIGSSGIVSEVMNKKRSLSKSMIRKLSVFLNIDQEILNTPYTVFPASKKPRTVKSRELMKGIKTSHPLFSFIEPEETMPYKIHVRERGALLIIGC